MKKKLLITLLALAATLTCTLAFSACDLFGGILGNENSKGENTEEEDNGSTTPEHNHDWSLTYTEYGNWHYQTCSGCQDKNYDEHTYVDGFCVCGHAEPIEGTDGLKYRFSPSTQSYILEEIGTATGTEITVAAYYENFPVATISSSAFENCFKLTSITLPNTVTSIGARAFYGCDRLESVNIPKCVTEIGEFAFYNCRNLQSITIPDGVTTINKNAFKKCSNLASVTLGNKVTGIMESAFEDCAKLTDINIPDSVNTIDNYAFKNCSSLKNLTIPEAVTYIKSSTFYGCTSLTSINIPSKATYIGSSVFESCSALESITIPDSVTYIGSYSFYSCHSLTNITFKGTVEQWNEITRGSEWDGNTGEYTIHCTDGEIAKDGTVTMY